MKFSNYFTYLYNEKSSLPPGKEREEAQANVPLGHKIKKLVAERKPLGAKIYYHIDLDGVTSAIAMKWFLMKQGITKFMFEAIQYGSREFAITETPNNWLAVLVDFAHGKPFIDLHTDHHSSQIGAAGITGFVQAASNAEAISKLDPSADAFSASDISVINMTDSAAYAGKFTPEEVRQFIFDYKKSEDLERNKIRFGMTVNKFLLAIKNKKINNVPFSLLNLILQKVEKPSLMALNMAMRKEIRQLPNTKWNFKTPKEASERGEDFVKSARQLVVEGNIENIEKLAAGQSMQVGNLILQFDASRAMMMGGYDRYVPFDIHPNGDYLCIGWSMGLVQVSKNPFKKGSSPIHLGEFMLGDGGVLEKYKSELQKTYISLATIKRLSESEVMKSTPYEKSIGYQFKDMEDIFTTDQIAIYSNKEKKIVKLDDKIESFLTDKTKTNYSDAPEDIKDALSRVSVNAWDFIKSQSGGHKDITNISGLNYLPDNDFYKGGGGIIKKIMKEVAIRMKDMSLEEPEEDNSELV